MNTALLQTKFAQLKERPESNPAAVDAIEQWILQSDPFQRLRMHAFEIADYARIDVYEVVEEFLHGVPIGLFDLHWDVHCPHCDMVTSEVSSLSDATELSSCKMCQVDFQADFLERVEVAFTLNRAIEYLDIPPICPPPPSIKPRFNMSIPYQQTASAHEWVEAGVYRYSCPVTGSLGVLVVTGDETDQLQEFNITQLQGRFDPDNLEAQPGPIKLNVTNETYPLSGCWIAPHKLPILKPQDLPQRLSGLALIHYPSFRKLFSDQVLSSRERMQIAANTILFTDITGSTRMYELLGDTDAYNIVRDHFDILFASIETHGGRIVKTIGDAVMASFLSNEQAIQCIIDFLNGIKEYNTGKGVDEQVHLKIGMHRGAAILVNLNDRLDYFGSTINKAARIQARSRSNELSFSKEIYEDEDAMKILHAAGISGITHEVVNLKGLEGEHTIYKIKCA